MLRIFFFRCCWYNRYSGIPHQSSCHSFYLFGIILQVPTVGWYIARVSGCTSILLFNPVEWPACNDRQWLSVTSSGCYTTRYLASILAGSASSASSMMPRWIDSSTSRYSRVRTSYFCEELPRPGEGSLVARPQQVIQAVLRSDTMYTVATGAKCRFRDYRRQELAAYSQDLRISNICDRTVTTFPWNWLTCLAVPGLINSPETASSKKPRVRR